MAIKTGRYGTVKYRSHGDRHPTGCGDHLPQCMESLIQNRLRGRDLFR